jgi:hypothetical protein
MIYNNAEISKLFKDSTIHVLDYDFEYDAGFPCEKEFPEFNNKLFRTFNSDTSMCTGRFVFGDLESGATMTLNVISLSTSSRPCLSPESSDIRLESHSSSTTLSPR